MTRKKKPIEDVVKTKTKSTPEFLVEFKSREGTREARSLHKALNFVANNGLRGLDEKKLKQVGLPIIREARLRMRLLEDAGLTDSPAYRHIKREKIDLSTGGKDTNTIRHNIKEAYDFLHAGTSLVKKAREYNDWLDSHLGYFTNKEEREEIWDVVHKFEDTHTGHFINYGYDESIRKIAQVSQHYGFNLNEIIQSEAMLPENDRIVTGKIGAYLAASGYLSAEKLGEFLESESTRIGLDNLYGVELFEGTMTGWFKGRSSMNDF